MPFRTQSIRQWEKEWRESDWRETIPLASGRECPNCWATVCSGRSWRAHWAKHQRDADRIKALQDQVAALSRAVHQLSFEAGHADWYPDPEEPEEPDDLDERLTRKATFVIGMGELPEEMRGGED